MAAPHWFFRFMHDRESAAWKRRQPEQTSVSWVWRIASSQDFRAVRRSLVHKSVHEAVTGMPGWSGAVRSVGFMLDRLPLPPLPTLQGERVLLREPRDSDVDDRPDYLELTGRRKGWRVSCFLRASFRLRVRGSLTLCARVSYCYTCYLAICTNVKVRGLRGGAAKYAL